MSVKPGMTISEFAIQHDLTFVVEPWKRDVTTTKMFRASFKDFDIAGEAASIEAHGYGKTAEEAILDYAKNISGQILVPYNGYEDGPPLEDEEIEAPPYFRVPQLNFEKA